MKNFRFIAALAIILAGCIGLSALAEAHGGHYGGHGGGYGGYGGHYSYETLNLTQEQF